MGQIRGCEIPEHLYYDVDNNIWLRDDGDHRVTVGLTSYAVELRGAVVSCTLRTVGKTVRKEKSCATVETRDWVGPVKVPVDGEIVAVNDRLAVTPELINRDPYGKGWLVQIRVNDWERARTGLVTGLEETLGSFEARMEYDGFPGC